MRVVLFDGVCNLCNSTIQFIIKRDVNNEFLFSSLQSEYGRQFLRKNNLSEKEYSTIILIEEDTYYTKSTAFLNILKHLKGYHFISKSLFYIPKVLRDLCYSMISKNRYLIFGKSKGDSCMLPNKRLNQKFIN